ncbi:TubC N-terminal docking domain-related protein, partial [Pedobacter psychrotolerans]|uniref:TubC N-terminal docking domain-related protein n=1 Tax=Pedobacter psychrotolerans TaxID=1843235 RepID=UPI001666755B
MKEVIKLILELVDLDVKIYLENRKLKVDFPKDFNADLIVPRIKAHKEELITYLSVNRISLKSIPVLSLQVDYELSSSQRRLWVLSQFEDGNIAYNMPGAYV